MPIHTFYMNSLLREHTRLNSGVSYTLNVWWWLILGFQRTSLLTLSVQTDFTGASQCSSNQFKEFNWALWISYNKGTTVATVICPVQSTRDLLVHVHLPWLCLFLCSRRQDAIFNGTWQINLGKRRQHSTMMSLLTSDGAAYFPGCLLTSFYWRLLTVPGCVRGTDQVRGILQRACWKTVKGKGKVVIEE